MTERIASLDFLRGAAALAVAIPHFFMMQQTGSAFAETVSILGVEIFFVLSGYVLAPQILFFVVERPDYRNFGIFLVRRWMRTVPPYLIALLIASVTAHKLWTADLARYALYVQNLFQQSNTGDYFPIAWSLSVEEWFYLTFPPFFMVVAATVRQRRPRAIVAGLGFIAAITLLRAGADWSHWGAEVRRVVAFRVDAVAWGFLVYLVTSRTRLLILLTPAAALVALVLLGTLALALTMRLAAEPSLTIEAAFHVYASAMGAAAIVAALSLSDIFQRHAMVVRASLYLGRISYSIYLFHLLALTALARFAMPWALMLILYLLLTCGVAALMASAVEAPILAARPRFRNKPPPAIKNASPQAA